MADNYGRPITFRLDDSQEDEGKALAYMQEQEQAGIGRRKLITKALLNLAQIAPVADDNLVLATELRQALEEANSLSVALNTALAGLNEATRLIERLSRNGGLTLLGEEEVARTAPSLQLPQEFVQKMLEQQRPAMRLRDTSQDQEDDE